MIGETVGSYRITSKLSTGGMGTVYKAEHALIGKLAAVKVLHPELCNNREIVNRFFNEAKATTTIKHPGIVEIFDFGYMESGDAFIVMEFLEGMSMARRLKHKGRMNEGEAAMVMRGVCNALAAAHAKKIIHRDLKPDNLFLCPDPEAPTGERPKILDFGIAKLTDGAAGQPTVTQTGAVMGTPTYMSPEQCRGTGDIDERADLYSIGCIYYELLTGRPPFANMSAGELIGAHLYIEPEKPTVHEPSVSPESEALIMKLIAKDPAKRPHTARELGLEFATLAKNHGWISHTNPTAFRAPESSTSTAMTTEEYDATLASPPGMSAPMAAASPPDLATPPGRVSPPDRGSAPAPAPMQPTTLSGAASQSVVNPPRRRIGLFAGVAAAFAVVGTVSFVVVRGSHDDRPAATEAVKPAAAPAAAPTPTPTPPTSTPPTPAPPVATNPVEPPATAPPVVAPAVASPPVTKPITKPIAKPITKPVKRPAIATNPAATKPATKPVDPHKPGTGSGAGKILIETDL
jgi:serine/threonine-protein kinase